MNRTDADTPASTRTLVEASWNAAKLAADQRGALSGTVATVAGQYLEFAGGNAQVAGTICPVAGLFWERVRDVLLRVHLEERTVVKPAPRSNNNVVPFKRVHGR